VILLDIMVPHLNGWEICRRLKQDRESAAIPVIMVTGRVEEGDKVLGFEMGADDYVTKPFSPRELLARVRAVTRRGRPTGVETGQVLRAGDLEIDRQRFEVKMKGRIVELTRKEFDLLALLGQRPGVVFRREQIISDVWQTSWEGTGRTLEVHIASLRAKLRRPELVETVRGVGYRLALPTPPAA
jgi:DNA-binding response OmpR family regulator